MKKKILTFIFVFAFIFLSYNFDIDDNFLKAEVGRSLTVVSCPTYHDYLPELSEKGFQIVRASSTKEALEIFENGEADFVISGRKLKSNEPNLKSLKIDNGYSFLAKEELTVTETELDEFDFYTDLNKKEVLNSFPQLEDDLEKVKDPYSKIEEGIIITSFENTNYSKSELVHVTDEFGRRIKASRRPTIYFENNQQKAKEIINIINKLL
ncbi:MAG: hypothetical protein ACQEP3_00720 [Patescibacteria group bacterium]